MKKKMRRETKVVIDYLRSPRLFTEVLKTLSKTKKIRYIKKMLNLYENTELTQVQCNLFYVGLSKIEWDIVIQELDGDGEIDIKDNN